MNPLKVKGRAANLSTSLLSGKPEQTDRDYECPGVVDARGRSALDQELTHLEFWLEAALAAVFTLREFIACEILDVLDVI